MVYDLCEDGVVYGPGVLVELVKLGRGALQLQL